MASPFPGMNPYLEEPANWSDFHITFINCAREILRTVLPDHYTARVGERVYLVEGPPPVRHLAVPDVAIERQPGAAPTSPATAAGVLSTPVTLPLPPQEEPLETYIEILHRSDRSLVTAIELLSPGNKEDPGRTAFLTKRNALLRQKVHLVELDLLLGGQRLPLRLPLPRGDYYAFVAHADRRPDCDVYAWRLEEPFPTIPIPLRAPDPDVVLDLGGAFRLTYERGGYEREIDVGVPPAVRLTDDQRRWVEECVNKRNGSGTAQT